MASILPLYIVIFIAYFGYGITVPIFTTMMIQPTNPEIASFSLGLRTTLLGALLATFPTGQFLGGSIIGAFSDQYGRKKVLITSLLLACLCYLGIGVALWSFSLPFIFVCLFVAGFFESNIMIAQNAIADVVPKHQRTVKFGYVQACVSSGYFAGPLLGGFISNPNYLSWARLWTPFILVSFFLLISAFWLLWKFKETYKPHRVKHLFQIKSLTNIKNVFLDKHLRFFYGINALLYFCIFGYFRNALIYISAEFKIDVTLLSLFTSYIAFFMILINFFFIKPISKRFSPYFATGVTALLMGGFMITIPLFPFLDSLWITLGLTTFFLAICLPSCTAMISHAADQTQQGRVMGNNVSVLGGMQALSAFLGGVLASSKTFLPLTIFGVVSIFSGVILFLNRKREKDIAHL